MTLILVESILANPRAHRSGDGRADYLCLEKDGRVTGALNKAGLLSVKR